MSASGKLDSGSPLFESLPVIVMSETVIGWPVTVGPRASTSTPREPGVRRTVVLTMVTVLVVLPCRKTRMPGPRVPPEPATAALPTTLPSIRAFIVPPVALDDVKMLMDAPPLPVMVVLFMRRAYIWPAPPPPPWSLSMAVLPALLVKVQPLTVTVPVAGAPTPSPTIELSLDWTCNPDEALPEKVTPEKVAVFRVEVWVMPTWI